MGKQRTKEDSLRLITETAVELKKSNLSVFLTFSRTVGEEKHIVICDNDDPDERGNYITLDMPAALELLAVLAAAIKQLHNAG